MTGPTRLATLAAQEVQVIGWLRARTLVAPSAPRSSWTSVGDLYRDYHMWAHRAALQPMTQPDFNFALSVVLPQVPSRMIGGRKMRPIKLLPHWEPSLGPPF